MMILKHNQHWTYGLLPPILGVRGDEAERIAPEKRLTNRLRLSARLTAAKERNVFAGLFAVAVLVIVPLLSIPYGKDSRQDRRSL
jgi:hypothetical protein